MSADAPKKRYTLREQNESLQGIVERMATQHVTFFDKAGKEYHPDWCPLCRLEKAEEIGSPKAIAEWLEVVLRHHAIVGNLSEKSIDKGAAHIGYSAGDLIRAVREWDVIL